jgi:hypothetical protein
METRLPWCGLPSYSAHNMMVGGARCFDPVTCLKMTGNLLHKQNTQNVVVQWTALLLPFLEVLGLNSVSMSDILAQLFLSILQSPQANARINVNMKFSLCPPRRHVEEWRYNSSVSNWFTTNSVTHNFRLQLNSVITISVYSTPRL